MHVTNPDHTLADLVTSAPASARVLERFGLDYCCGGQSTLVDACATRNVDVDAVLAALAAVEPQSEPDWATMPPAALVDHLESVHHQYLHEEMPRLAALAEKVGRVHGGRHPELAQVRAVYERFRTDMDAHLLKEERVLFPMVRELATAGTVPQFHCGSLRNPISVMLREHDDAGAQLEQLRTLTGAFEPPADGCASYRALYAGLADLERDTHLHVHKENNLLFPAVVELEQSVVNSL
jgi:regulator of cell morphogenesis and NO signaling